MILDGPEDCAYSTVKYSSLSVSLGHVAGFPHPQTPKFAKLKFLTQTRVVFAPNLHISSHIP